MDNQNTPENRISQKNTTITNAWSSYVPYVIAIGILISYGFFIYFLLGKVGDDEREWSRSIFLFTGVEAIVFAATGFLFGREVNRKRAQNAEQDKKEAEKAKKEAEKQKEEAKEQAQTERKNALILGAMAVQGERISSSASGQMSAGEGTALEGTALDSAPYENTARPQSALAGLAETARKLYPELEGK